MSVDRIPPSLAISVGVHALIAAAWWVVDVEPVKAVEVAPIHNKVELVEPSPETTVEVVMLDPAALARVPA